MLRRMIPFLSLDFSFQGVVRVFRNSLLPQLSSVQTSLGHTLDHIYVSFLKSKFDPLLTEI